MKKVVFAGLLAISVVLLIGCVNTREITADPGVKGEVARKNYEIVGTVSIEKPVHTILGIFSWGGSTYKELLAQAQEMGADGIINIYKDRKDFRILIFYWSYTDIITATAIKYLDAVPGGR